MPQLLGKGYDVTVYDMLLLRLPSTCRRIRTSRLIQGDIRDTPRSSPRRSRASTWCCTSPASRTTRASSSTRTCRKTINFDCFEPMVLAAKKAGVQRFVYCSSSSVYGVTDQPDVTEDHPLVPLTLYNKYKGMCEPLLFKHQAPGFTCVTIRPATVCGYSPAHAARPVGQHPDQPRGQQGHDHRVRRQPDAPEPAHRGHGRRLRADDRGARREDRRRDLQRRLSEPHDREIAEIVRDVVAAGVPGRRARSRS